MAGTARLRAVVAAAAVVEALSAVGGTEASRATAPEESSRLFAALYGTTMIAADDAWAVGARTNIHRIVGHALIVHWDGTNWTRVPAPRPGRNARLAAVEAISTTDVWAVGAYTNRRYFDRALIEHWDGREWTLVPTPGVKPLSALSSVSALSATDIWAVGTTYVRNTDDDHALTMHWDGSVWRRVPTPHQAYVNRSLSGVAAITPNDVWAVGAASSDDPTDRRSFALHWDGTRWSRVSTPDLWLADALSSVSAVSSTDVWAVGASSADAGGRRTFALHWDGDRWTEWRTRYPPAALASQLESVAARSRNDVWAVGSYSLPRRGSMSLIEHFNGRSWTRVRPPPMSCCSVLTGVAAAATTDAVAVGARWRGRDGGTLAIRWNGTRWVRG